MYDLKIGKWKLGEELPPPPKEIIKHYWLIL